MYFFSVKDSLMTRLGMDTHSTSALAVPKYAYSSFSSIAIDKISLLRIPSLIGSSCSRFVIASYSHALTANSPAVKKCVLEWRKNATVLTLPSKGAGEPQSAFPLETFHMTTLRSLSPPILASALSSVLNANATTSPMCKERRLATAYVVPTASLQASQSMISATPLEMLSPEAMKRPDEDTANAVTSPA